MKKVLKVIGKILLILLAAIIGILGILGVFGCIANPILVKNHLEDVAKIEKVSYENQLVPQKDTDGVWTFTTDNDLKIMQLTDVHIGAGWMCNKKDSMAINAVATMINVEKPDLVIVTGDIAYPVPFQAGTFDNMKAADIFASLMESLGVYWIPTFGNHDTESYSKYTREGISDFYAQDKWTYCLFEDNSDDNVDGYCNQVINVKNSQGIITQTLYTLDTHSYVDNDHLGLFWKYDNVHENQISWYKDNVEKYNKYNIDLINNGDFENKAELLEKYSTVKSLAFWHIPIEEYRFAWDEYVKAHYQDTENVKHYYGSAHETGKIVFSGIYPDQMFETMLELDSTKGVFCGHDHVNNFSLEYKGIRLTYGMSIDYLAYIGISKEGSQRGCTMITVKPDGSFDCTPENYYQDKYAHDAREEVIMQFMSVME